MPSYLTSSAVANGKGWDGTANKIRRAMLHSGRHLDIARFNEKQQRVGLKRLLGMLGYQILESDRLKHDSIIETIDDLVELIAYNVSDVVNLAYLADHPTYSGGFDLKHALMVGLSRDCLSGCQRFQVEARLQSPIVFGAID